MHSCGSKIAIIADELGIYECNQNDYSKIPVLMYKRLHREHLLLESSFAAISHTLNQTLCKSQGSKEYYNSNVQKKRMNTKSDGLKRQFDLITCKSEEKIELNQLSMGVHESEQIKMSSVPENKYKKLCKEHLNLERSFATVCQSFNEAVDKSQRPKQHISNTQQKKSNKKESDGLKRQIELLTLELQEARDQNELFEFRIHELEQIKSSTKPHAIEKNCLIFENNLKDDECQHHYNEMIACLKCAELESRLSEVNNEKQSLNERFNASKRVLHELEEKYALKAELQDLLHKNCTQNNDALRNGEPENAYICSAMTSEDEGLGDDTRRDHSSGPSSLADLQESDFDVVNKNKLTLEFNIKDQFKQINKIGIEKSERIQRANKKCVSTQTECEELLRLELVKSQGYIEELECNLDRMKEEKACLEEQVLELEEAENDSRLISQRLQQQLETFLDQYETMQSDLISANKTIDQNKNKIKNFEKIEFELRTQISDIRNSLMYRNDNQTYDESNKSVRNKINSYENESKHIDQRLQEVDSLYSFLWEKLCRLETQIDSFRDALRDSNKYYSSQDFDDDLQLFISAEKLSEGVTNIGSSFDASQFDKSSGKPYIHCNANGRLDSLVLSLPICETVKPERIDLMCNSSKIRSSSPECLPSDIIFKVNKLETNEQLLRDRLTQLEWINKEFVRELELREKIFFEKEKTKNEWLCSENELKSTINELESEKNDLVLKVNDLESERIILIEQLVCLRDSFEETKLKHEIQLRDAQNDHNIVVIELQKHITELENKELEYKAQIQANHYNPSNDNNSIENMNQNYEVLKEDLQKERENITKLKDNFANELSNLINYQISHEKELKNQIENLENKESDFTNELSSLLGKEDLLKQLLIEKESDLKKLQCIHEKRIEILEEEHKIVEQELRMKMEEMESKSSTTVNELEMERILIQKQLQQSFEGLECKQLEYVKKIEEIGANVYRLESKLSEFEENKKQINQIESEREKLRLEVVSLQLSEEELRNKLNEMMQKEAAYEETLSKADKIVATLEQNYKQRIEELENCERNLKTKITQMEETEIRLRSTLRPERRTSDSYRKASDLVKELIDAEARECLLREQIRTLESSVNQLEQQLREEDQRKTRMESELKDQDELVSTVVNLQQEIESLKKDLNKSLQSQDSLQEMLKETEKYCLQRDEEMQNKYKSLEDQKCDLEISVQQLKHRLRHSDIKNDCYDSIGLIDNYNSINASDNKTIDNTRQCSENELNDSQELNDVRLNMEKCLKRAMAVVTLQIQQKDNMNDIPIVENEETFSSLSLSSSPCSSEDCEQGIQDFDVLMDETNDSSSSSSSSFSMSSRNIKPLPPKNFKIISKVNSDSLLIGWQMHPREDFMGYQIMVNDQIVQKVRNPKATKALLNKLDLSKNLLIKIVSVSYFGQLSNEVAILFTPTDSSANH